VSMVTINVGRVHDIDSAGHYSDRHLVLRVWMSKEQQRAAAMEIIGAMPEQEVGPWLRSEMPEIFTQEQTA